MDQLLPAVRLGERNKWWDMWWNPTFPSFPWAKIEKEEALRGYFSKFWPNWLQSKSGGKAPIRPK